MRGLGLALLLALLAGCSGTTEPKPDPGPMVEVDRMPSWDPTGTKLVYVHSPDELRILDIASRTSTVLGHGSEPKWSPDGKSIAYSADDGIHVLEVQALRDTLLFDRGQSPAWSWDSRWLAFEMYDSLGLHVRMHEIATGVQRRLDVTDAMMPCWIPGDSALVVVTLFPDGASTLLRVNLDGSARTRLLPNRTFDSEPAVSPDGTHVAWLRLGGNTRELGIFVTRFGATSEDFLANYGQDPAWSPDGSQIAFAGYNPEQNSISLWMMRSDGAGQVRLTGP